MDTLTKSTIIDKYISRDQNDTSSLYQFICRNGKVPVISGPTQANWPLDENYCKLLYYSIGQTGERFLILKIKICLGQKNLLLS